jgi:acylphosphatase
MRRLTAYVSGKVQEVGYRGRIVGIARELGLTGIIENLLDGRVKIIAEGDDEKLKLFESAIDMKNALIYVSSIDKEYSPAMGEFSSFGKVVARGETDTRLDTAAGYLKELVFAVNNMNDNLGGKMDKMLEKQDMMLDKQDSMLVKQDETREEIVNEIRSLGDKMDKMLDKQDSMLEKQDKMLDKQDSMLEKQDDTREEIVNEIRFLRGDLKSSLDERFMRIQTDIDRIKAKIGL